MKLKNMDDVKGIRKSCALLAETFEYIESIIKPGTTGYDLDRVAEEFIRARGGVPAFKGYGGFPAALCLSLNDAVIHGIPKKEPFKIKDVISVDCGINLNGYFSDSAHTFTLGPQDQAVTNLLRIAEESLFLGIEEARKGNRINDISRAIFKHNRQNGYGIVRPYCGHGVGFGVHEEPQVPNYVGSGPNPRLKVGLVLAIEPMINLGTDEVYVAKDDWTVLTKDHSISVHFEHTIVILEDSTEILTLWGSKRGYQVHA